MMFMETTEGIYVMFKNLSNFQCCSVGQHVALRQESAPERSAETRQLQPLGSSDPPVSARR